MSSSRLQTAFETQGLNLPLDQKIGIFRATSDFDFGALAGQNLVLVQGNRPEFDRLTARGFDVVADLNSNVDHAIVQITRSKAETMGVIAEAIGQLKPGGFLIVDGTKTDGIESIQKRLKAHFSLSDTLSKAHGKLIWLVVPETLPSAVDEWREEAQPSLGPSGLSSAPGMFSHGKIDTGSALLVPHISTGLKGKVSDLGAGWGFLSKTILAQAGVSELHLYEADFASLEAAKKNLAHTHAFFHWSDVQTLQADSEYDFVISNPPFHTNRKAEPDLGRTFIRKASELLVPSGVFWMVANRQLPYEAELSECFQRVETVEETHHFKIIRATRPKTSSRKVTRASVSSHRKTR